MSEAKKCFFIAPIGEANSPVRKKSDQVLKFIVGPAVANCGFSSPVRADHLPFPGIITSQVIERIVEDDLVVADLTGENPNVFYELAIRHAIRKPVLHLISKDEDIPFDVSMSRAIRYDIADPDSIEEARGELEKQANAVLKNPEKADNPISIALDLGVLRRSDDPERRSLAELTNEVARISADIRAMRHDANVVDRFRMWEKLDDRFKSIERFIGEVKNSLAKFDGYDLDDIESRLEDVELKLE